MLKLLDINKKKENLKKDDKDDITSFVKDVGT